MKKKFVWLIFYLTYYLLFPFILLATGITKKNHDTLIWGVSPILNNKYWSEAMKRKGYKSITLMTNQSKICIRDDYDLYYEDLFPPILKKRLLILAFGPLLSYLYIIRNASAIHIPYGEGPLGITSLWRLEAYLYRWCKIKVIVLPYGGDSYMYAKVVDKSLQNGLLLSYPLNAKSEIKIEKKVSYWTRNADVIINGIMGVDGFGRWDVTIPQFVCINTEGWIKKTNYSANNGKNGPVNIIHTPNHRGFKGTEFIVDAVNQLREEGLQINLILIEGKTNAEVKLCMQEADILAEQIIAVAYALSAIEGMATGLPVLSNLDNENYTRVFRRYSFLNECPILSTTPENIKDNLRLLITNSDLRRELGEAGRKYVEKYHSYETAQYLFGSIYGKILEGKDVDLMNLFHPLKSSYNNTKKQINHPLVENKYIKAKE